MSILGKVTGLIGSHSQRRLASKEKRLAKSQANIGIDRAERARQVFMEESPRRRMALNEELARRGMSQSTFAEDQKRQFQTANDRSMAALDEDVLLANQGADVTKYGYQIAKRFTPLKIFDTLGDIGETVGGAAMGLSGLGGGGGTKEQLSSANFNLD